ncbi:CAMK/CAMK-unique protein kinase [Mycena venus]|uniref:CAMK/CAMK-unique protein kinase n=1 Tax=Mycena venus TaxID=2733690 RepID=A0A8H6YXJ7_9AGAR|nr:CAMK/CAMK-unique protein kinase [Mycena venus]
MDSFEPRLVLKILGGTYVPPTNVNARTLAVLHGCLAARVQDRWGVERVDEAAWCVGGEDMPNDSVDSDECPDAAEHPHPRHPHGHAHAAKHPPPAPLPLDLDRGRPGAAARRASDRAERSSSRAPVLRVALVCVAHALAFALRPLGVAVRALGVEVCAIARARWRGGGGSSSESHSQSQSRSRSRTGSRSRSRSPGPRTPVDSLPPLLGFAAIGLGFPTGKGPGRGFAAPGSSVEGRRGAGVSEEGEGVGEGGEHAAGSVARRRAWSRAQSEFKRDVSGVWGWMVYRMLQTQKSRPFVSSGFRRTT